MERKIIGVEQEQHKGKQKWEQKEAKVEKHHKGPGWL